MSRAALLLPALLLAACAAPAAPVDVRPVAGVTVEHKAGEKDPALTAQAYEWVRRFEARWGKAPRPLRVELWHVRKLPLPRAGGSTEHKEVSYRKWALVLVTTKRNPGLRWLGHGLYHLQQEWHDPDHRDLRWAAVNKWDLATAARHPR